MCVLLSNFLPVLKPCVFCIWVSAVELSTWMSYSVSVYCKLGYSLKPRFCSIPRLFRSMPLTYRDRTADLKTVTSAPFPPVFVSRFYKVFFCSCFFLCSNGSRRSLHRPCPPRSPCSSSIPGSSAGSPWRQHLMMPPFSRCSDTGPIPIIPWTSQTPQD